MSALTGDTLSSFPVAPAGSPGFTVFYDIDVVGASGNILVVSSYQPVLRLMSPTGAWIQDIDLTPLGVAGMSGIAWDDATGTAWISSTNGSVYHLEGIPPS